MGPEAWPKGSSEAPARYPQASCPDRQAEAAVGRGVPWELSEPHALRQAGRKVEKTSLSPAEARGPRSGPGEVLWARRGRRHLPRPPPEFFILCQALAKVLFST